MDAWNEHRDRRSSLTDSDGALNSRIIAILACAIAIIVAFEIAGAREGSERHSDVPTEIGEP